MIPTMQQATTVITMALSVEAVLELDLLFIFSILAGDLFATSFYDVR